MTRKKSSDKVKKGNVSVSYDADKLDVLNKYMEEQNRHIEVEMINLIDWLYDRYVPPNVRKYIEFRALDKNMDTQKTIS